MRVFYVKRITVLIMLLVLGFAVAVGIPAARAAKQLSPETREYWLGSYDIIWHIDAKEKMIALTFDDGPSPTFTPQILEILRKNKIKGTFFVIATEAERYPDLMRQAVSEGHEIANHTYSHKYMNGVSREDIRKELMLADQAIKSATGVKPSLFRPPGGYYNADIVAVAKELGYKVVIWSWEQQSGDWANPGTSVIVRRVLKNAESGNIVVFHDRGGDRRQTVQALQPIIDGLTKEGFKLVTVSEMLHRSITKNPK